MFSDFDPRPPLEPGNPLQASFMKFLEFAISNISKGKIPFAESRSKARWYNFYRCRTEPRR